MKNWLKYVITAAIGFAMAALIIFTGGVFNQPTKADTIELLVNGFFVPGVIILGFGLLVVASNGGTFDMLVFGTKKFFDLFRKPHNRRITDTFYDYRKAKQEHKGEFLYMILVGLGFIIVSLILLIFWYQA